MENIRNFLRKYVLIGQQQMLNKMFLNISNEDFAAIMKLTPEELHKLGITDIEGDYVDGKHEQSIVIWF